jgi:hypothetical protein
MHYVSEIESRLCTDKFSSLPPRAQTQCIASLPTATPVPLVFVVTVIFRCIVNQQIDPARVFNFTLLSPPHTQPSLPESFPLPDTHLPEQFFVGVQVLLRLFLLLLQGGRTSAALLFCRRQLPGRGGEVMIDGFAADDVPHVTAPARRSAASPAVIPAVRVSRPFAVRPFALPPRHRSARVFPDRLDIGGAFQTDRAKQSCWGRSFFFSNDSVSIMLAAMRRRRAFSCQSLLSR